MLAFCCGTDYTYLIRAASRFAFLDDGGEQETYAETNHRRSQRYQLNRQRFQDGWLRYKARWFIQRFCPNTLSTYNLHWDADSLLDQVWQM